MSDALTLGQLIGALKSVPDRKKILPRGFGKAHSWRGIYAELAFEPVANVSIEAMLQEAERALGSTFEGWKGGEFVMNSSTPVHVSYEGSSEDFLGQYLLFYMLGAPVREMCELCREYYPTPVPSNHTKVQCLETQLAQAKAAEAKR